MHKMNSGGRGSSLTAAEMKTATSHRTWSAMNLGKDRTCHAFLMIEGSGKITEANEIAIALTGPCLVWLPENSPSQFHLSAGGRGATFSVKSEFILRTLGAMSFGQQLRPNLDSRLVLPSERLHQHLDEISVSFSALVREANEQAAGSQEMISAHLGLIFLHVWRISSLVSARRSAQGANLPTAQRFQNLLELHYHENLNIDEYAEILGVTRAHLHSACLRALERTPLSLVHERIIDEAIQRLEHTTLPVEQVAYSLGFRESGYFNRFFKRLTGETPGAYRLRVVSEKKPVDGTSFAAWP